MIMKRFSAPERVTPTQAQRDRGMELLKRSVDKSKRHDQVPFAKEFLRSPDGTPPLARLIRGGRGGEVRLKLYLTITMMATRAPYDITRPPSPNLWTQMLGVTGDQPVRRVSDALRWLRDGGFIGLIPRAGTLPLITLLDPQGPAEPGRPYSRPMEKGSPYISLPLTLWTNGWIIDLPATSLALMMVIRDVQQGKDQAKYTYSDERAMYGLSADTWTRGRNDLERRGLLEVRRVPQGGDFDYQRMRNLYRVRLEQLGALSSELPQLVDAGMTISDGDVASRQPAVVRGRRRSSR
jgi:hypothetical protein